VVEPEVPPQDAAVTIEIIRGTERERVKLDELGAAPSKEKQHGQP